MLRSRQSRHTSTDPLFPLPSDNKHFLKKSTHIPQKNPHNYQPNTMEFTTTTHFKSQTSEGEYGEILEKCNSILAEDYGDFKFTEAPDLLAVARSKANDIVGFLSLSHTPKTGAWELETLSARMPYRHKKLLSKFIEHLPGDIAAHKKGQWLVKRVKASETRHISDLQALGFSRPSDWLEGILSDEGYVPFDPSEEFLMKRKL